MISADPAQCVRKDGSGVAASLRKTTVAAKRECPGNRNLRNADRPCYAAVDSKRRRVVGVIRIEYDVDAVAAKPYLVHQRWSDDPTVIQAEQLTPAGSLVSHTGKAVSVGGGRLIPCVLLDRVIDVETVVLRENLAEVDRPLLNVH